MRGLTNSFDNHQMILLEQKNCLNPLQPTKYYVYVMTVTHNLFDYIEGRGESLTKKLLLTEKAKQLYVAQNNFGKMRRKMINDFCDKTCLQKYLPQEHLFRISTCFKLNI